jgi:hypothetical protein
MKKIAKTGVVAMFILIGLMSFGNTNAQKENQVFTSVSKTSNTNSDTAKNSISNVR